MAADFSSSLCVGVKMSKVFKIATITETVTKFNPDSGEPYQKQVSVDKLIFFGIPISPPEESYPGEWVNVDGLRAYTTGNYCYTNGKGFRKYDYDQIVIGKELKDTGSHRSRDHESVLEVTQDQIAAAFAEVKEKFAKLGYTDEVSLYLINCSTCNNGIILGDRAASS